ncbi:thiamine phosphate synthase [Sutcliffiella deserti]|uniref:thiamine phosphate synthase n=1 Tax=Sutcliffiella deserti TaxID=2875501 RepID=UPI001CC0A33E|nr:thiamine phosphate synthase [Sutcliffiella deserti]
MSMARELLRLYFVMGSSNCRDQDPLKVLQAAIDGGISLFQYREKGANAKTGEEKKKLAEKLMAKCRMAGIPFIVNDDVELACSIGADGVHIGQDDGSILEIRKRMEGKLLGVSVHNVQEANEALIMGADYLGVGPMYFTSTKEDLHEIQGPGVIQQIRAAGVNLPIVGIGGITFENVMDVINAGADGVAIITAITHAQSPLEAAKELREMVEKAESSF